MEQSHRPQKSLLLDPVEPKNYLLGVLLGPLISIEWGEESSWPHWPALLKGLKFLGVAVDHVGPEGPNRNQKQRHVRDAPQSRLEAVRLEAIALRLEAIPTRFLLLLGWRPQVIELDA